MENNLITLEIVVQAPLQKAWDYWNQPEHIVQWCFASDDWHVPAAQNDLRVGGKLCTTMAAKDGSMSFNFEGVYSELTHLKSLAYEIEDGRKVSVQFEDQGDTTLIIESFEPETENPIEMQRAGWFAILQNFKKHVEN